MSLYFTIRWLSDFFVERYHNFEKTSERKRTRDQRLIGNGTFLCSSPSILLVTLKSPHTARTEPPSLIVSHLFLKAVRPRFSVITTRNRLSLIDQFIVDGMKPLFSASILLLFLPGEFLLVNSDNRIMDKVRVRILTKTKFECIVCKCMDFLDFLWSTNLILTVTEFHIRVTFLITFSLNCFWCKTLLVFIELSKIVISFWCYYWLLHKDLNYSKQLQLFLWCL